MNNGTTNKFLSEFPFYRAFSKFVTTGVSAFVFRVDLIFRCEIKVMKTLSLDFVKIPSASRVLFIEKAFCIVSIRRDAAISKFKQNSVPFTVRGISTPENGRSWELKSIFYFHFRGKSSFYSCLFVAAIELSARTRIPLWNQLTNKNSHFHRWIIHTHTRTKTVWKILNN